MRNCLRAWRDACADWAHDAVHVYDQGLGAASDVEVAALAASRHAILVSKDEDFATMCNLGELGCALLWIRFGNTTNDALWRRLEPVVATVIEAFESGEPMIELG
jgi:predicted nuclease of predicted toxin-antitoxin system